MRLHRRLLLLLAIPLVFVAACGDDDASAPEATAPPVAEDGETVVIDDFEFEPSQLEVEVGTTVGWTNKDGVAHTVTSDGDDSTLASGNLQEGEIFEHTFEEPGQYPYHCEIHPAMTATVTVTG